VFVLTHHVPEEPPPGAVRYCTDARECATRARAAAGDADVMVHGTGAARSLLAVGELDEMELHVVPVLLGQGRRLFDGIGTEPTELELTRVLTSPDDVDRAQRVAAPALPRAAAVTDR
jgi:dihydrofolate reductase